MLGGQLGRGVGREGIGHVGLPFAAQRLVAIGRRRGREDHPPHTRPASGVQHVDRARAAGRVAVQRAVDAPLDRGQGRLVENAIDARDRAIDRSGIDDVALDEFDGVAEAAQIGQIAGAEVIEHADAVAARDQRLGDVGADESGPAGYEKGSHG